MNPPTPIEVLKQYWGYEQFREPQAKIVQSIIEGKDTLALLPTGGGKSICFQVPGMCLGGLTIVISPLIALMKDQVENLQRVGIAATYINSSLSQATIDFRLQEAMDGKYSFLYLAPERIKSKIFLDRLPKMPVSLLVVDEAHCISQWGYDFRPSYLEIHHIRKLKPQIGVIAVTASAIPAVKQDIIERLMLKRPNIFVKSFKRENLRYFVLEEENVAGRIVEICKRTTGTGIVYVRLRKRAEYLAELLKEHNIQAVAYHGGMTTSDRNEIQQAWILNQYRVIVATNAFGMGIDKPDVRFVLHYQLPENLESYYQEAGRGGRDGKTALAICFRNLNDTLELERWVKEKYPTWEELTKIYQLLCNHFKIPNEGDVNQKEVFDMVHFCQKHKLAPKNCHNALKLLDKENLISYQEDKDDYAYLQSVCSSDDWIHFKRQPSKGALLADMILRNMGGAIYKHEVAFLPFVWANSLNWSTEELHQQLLRLVQAGMIQYTPALNMPCIIFLRNSQSLNQKAVQWSKYLFLQQQAEWRWSKLMEYVESKDKCRSVMIQTYFDDQDKQDCGKCDVCVNKKKQASPLNFATLQHHILTLIQQQPQITYRETLQRLTAGTLEEREAVLRYLIDKSIILSDVRGRLSVKET